MGMDRATGIVVSLSGYGSQGLGLMPPGSAWAVEREAGCAVPGWCEPADMEAQRAEAIQILKEEGFDFDKTYVLTVESDAQRVNRATFMQEQLRLLGIKTDFNTVETVAYRQLSQTGKWGDFLGSTGGVAGVDDPFIGLGHSHRCDSLYNFPDPRHGVRRNSGGVVRRVGRTHPAGGAQGQGPGNPAIPDVPVLELPGLLGAGSRGILAGSPRLRSLPRAHFQHPALVLYVD